MKKISLFLINDQSLFSKSFRNIIENDSPFDLVGSADKFEDGHAQIESHKPEFILIDYHLDNDKGLDVLLKVKELSYKATPIIMTFSKDEKIKDLALANGAKGYLLKDMNASDIVKALMSFLEIDKKEDINPLGFDSQTSKLIILNQLTKREYEIAQLVCDGFTSKDISQKLFLSLFTVKTHRRNILRKLNAKNTIEVCRILRLTK